MVFHFDPHPYRLHDVKGLKGSPQAKHLYCVAPVLSRGAQLDAVGFSAAFRLSAESWLCDVRDVGYIDIYIYIYYIDIYI